MPGSADVGICPLELGGGVAPRNGLEKYFKKVARRGNEAKLGSLDNCECDIESDQSRCGFEQRTRSFIVFITHSPPLRSGASLIRPTSASSAQTRRTGR